jgi:hypothetical protein
MQCIYGGALNKPILYVMKHPFCDDVIPLYIMYVAISMQTGKMNVSSNNMEILFFNSAPF